MSRARDIANLQSGAIINEAGADLDFRIESDDNANMFFVDGGNDRVGIGTASPSTPLHVVGNNGILIDEQGNGDSQLYFGGISGTDRTYLARSSNDFLMWNVSSGAVRFGNNNDEKFRIGSTGEIQIGGITNAGFIDFDGTSLQLNTQRNPNTGTFVNTSRSHAAINLIGSDGGSSIEMRTQGANNANASAVALEITSSGQVLCGGTSADSHIKILSAGTNATNYIALRNTSAADGSGTRYSYINYEKGI